MITNKDNNKYFIFPSKISGKNSIKQKKNRPEIEKKYDSFFINTFFSILKSKKLYTS